MSVYLAGTFSLNMLGLVPGMYALPLIEALTEERFVADLKDPLVVNSIVGNEAMATVLTEILGREVPCNREETKLGPGDVLYVASIEGDLPAGDEPELDKVREAAKAFYRVAIPVWPG